jgi:hypothetical protein
MDALNELQGCLDSVSGPCFILGDFNTRLPQSAVLKGNWHKSKAFSKRSALLYNFICENELCVSNFSFNQPVNYTWSNAKQRSYIDHILTPQHLTDQVSHCVGPSR